MIYSEALRSTIEPVWSRLLVHEKQEALQAIESHIAAFEGRNERIVSIENMGEGYYGYYNHSDSAHIHVSPYALRTPDEAIKTVLHEGRHAYQHDCIDHNEGFPQPILDQFRDGFDNYISPEENFKAYANNFTEIDAEDFAEKQSRLLNMEREAVLREQQANSEDRKLDFTSSAIPRKSERMEALDWNSRSASNLSENVSRGYDWANQSTFPELGREMEKVMGGSESETIAHNLHEIPMSPHDFQQYNQYYHSDEVASRPSEYQRGMGICLRNMATSLSEGNESAYYESRDRFLDIDSYYRSFEQTQESEFSTSEVNARKTSPEGHETDDIQKARSRAVKEAWEKEADRVREGRGTWDWTVEQQAELLSRSHTNNPGVSGFEGSHMLSAKDYPEHAGNPDNIQLIPTIAHYDGVHERNPREHTPNGIYNAETGEVMPIEDGKIPALREIELTDRYDPEQKNFHDANPDFEQSGAGRREGFKDTKERHSEKSIKSEHAESEENDSKESRTHADHIETALHSDASHSEDNDKDKERSETEKNTASLETEERSRDAKSNHEMNMAPNETESRSRAEHSDHEMNMAPNEAESRSRAEHSDHEMNMAPNEAESRSRAEHSDHEMNMAPNETESRSHAEHPDHEMNMAQNETEARGRAEHPDHDMNMEPTKSDERSRIEGPDRATNTDPGKKKDARPEHESDRSEAKQDESHQQSNDQPQTDNNDKSSVESNTQEQGISW